MQIYESIPILRKAAIAFASNMQEKSRWDMYERTLWFMQQYCLDDENTDILQEAVDAFVVLRKEYFASQMDMRERPLHQTAANKAFLEEYGKMKQK